MSERERDTTTTSTELVAVTSASSGPSPVDVYLASLAAGSRPAQRSALTQLARLLLPHDPTADAYTPRWQAVRYEHAQALRQLLADRYAPATANRMLCALRGVLKVCWRLNLLDGETYQRARDVAAVGGSRVDAGRALSHAELRGLLEVCADDPTPAGARDAAIIAVLYAAGLRVAELCALSLIDWRPDDRSLRVLGKRNKERIVYLEDAGARAALEDWLLVRGTVKRKDGAGPLFCALRQGATRLTEPLRRLDTATVRARILQKRAREAAISERTTPHDFRRTHIGDLLDAGVDLVTVSHMVGHANIATTARYDRRGERAKQSAAGQLRVPYVRRAGTGTEKRGA